VKSDVREAAKVPILGTHVELALYLTLALSTSANVIHARISNREMVRDPIGRKLFEMLFGIMIAIAWLYANLSLRLF
jgi:hypothetical protein